MLNNASLAISVVGLTGSFLGACSRLLLNFPEIIRIKFGLIKYNSDVMKFLQRQNLKYHFYKNLHF